ncbi:PREDICTED: uncharacterized protein LOC106808489 [Priapulus caudatus]|uniref:Uncharacterized protein LOC106808489 n=1 Tax=Priapulus caudatus TaxID=37621 RepID=A0ABM1E3E4_PRICU|nr:PREDICTED: uncharacterized protein LOC106808489 [Priapulus caudatus]
MAHGDLVMLLLARFSRIEAAISGVHTNSTVTADRCPVSPLLAPTYTPLAVRTLKFLALAGLMLLLLALYENAEYIFCYDEEKEEMRVKLQTNHRWTNQRSFGSIGECNMSGADDDDDDEERQTLLADASDAEMAASPRGRDADADAELGP